MRKNWIYLIALCAALMCSCSSKTKRIEGFENYKDACDKGRFDVAHQFIERMSEFEQYQPLRYLFAKEVELVAENLNRESIYELRNLFNRYKKIGTDQIDKMCESLIEKAIAKNNMNLCEELMQLHYDDDYPDALNIAILNMYKENDINKFRSFAIVRINDYKIDKYIKDYLSYTDDKELFRSLATKYQNNLFNEPEILALYERMYPEELKGKIRGELFKHKKDIPTRPSTGIVKSNMYREIPEEYLEYNSRVQAYNAQCFRMLSYACSFNDKTLANFIVSNMSSSLTYQSIGDWNEVVEKKKDISSAFDAYMVKTNNDEIEEAKQQINNYFSK